MINYGFLRETRLRRGHALRRISLQQAVFRASRFGDSAAGRRVEPATDRLTQQTPFQEIGVREESQLIDLALQGDRAAFTRLVELHQERLFASMLQITGSPDEAEEVVQEAFIRAFIKINTFQRNSQFFTWLYRIAFNSALTRKRRKRAKVSLDHVRETNGLEVSDSAGGVDEPLLRRERIAMVRQAMTKLSDDHRAILVLREMQDHTYEDIAEILEISIGTVRSRLSRARGQLKALLEAMQRAEESRG